MLMGIVVCGVCPSQSVYRRILRLTRDDHRRADEITHLLIDVVRRKSCAALDRGDEGVEVDNYMAKGVARCERRDRGSTAMRATETETAHIWTPPPSAAARREAHA